jgi:hypothetical protein
LGSTISSGEVSKKGSNASACTPRGGVTTTSGTASDAGSAECGGKLRATATSTRCSSSSQRTPV